MKNSHTTKSARKSMIIRPSGRSTDFLTPTIIMGCGFNCSYCYCKRHKTEGVDIANNLEQILTEVNSHAYFADVAKPNQTHPTYITYDIGCNTDISLHAKHIDWQKLFEFFRDHPIAMGSFATKYVNKDLLNFDPKGKIRIRFSLMPPKYAAFLEPKTSFMSSRILAVNDFIEAGYDVHLNFSPIIVTEGWLEEYESLFVACNTLIKDEHKDKVKAEVIFLTHNEAKHNFNLQNNLLGEDLLWQPEIQEDKISQYGGKNIRYKRHLKAQYIEEWTKLHDDIIPWNTIRYKF
jgi:spore photoproduct lyase